MLQIWVVLDLPCGLLVGAAVFCLDDAGPQSKPQWLGHSALAVGKQSGVPLLYFRPGDRLRLLYPAVVLFQIHAYWTNIMLS